MSVHVEVEVCSRGELARESARVGGLAVLASAWRAAAAASSAPALRAESSSRYIPSAGYGFLWTLQRKPR